MLKNLKSRGFISAESSAPTKLTTFSIRFDHKPFKIGRLRVRFALNECQSGNDA